MNLHCRFLIPVSGSGSLSLSSKKMRNCFSQHPTSGPATISVFEKGRVLWEIRSVS